MSIAFGAALSLKYEPPCVTISKGTTVTFKGNFSTHPLVGGTVKAKMGTPDPNSPIKATDMNTEASFTFAEVGSYPYYCVPHVEAGMFGAIFVK